MTDRGIDSWTDGRTARERVREVALSLTEPRSVEWIREQAQLSSWGTAKDELEMLVDFEQLQVVEGEDGNAKYAPNYQLRYFGELTGLINDHTRDELREEIANIQAEIDEWSAEYGVESREELESTLANPEYSGEAVRERNEVLREWERREDNRRLLRHALELYDDARALRPDRSGSSPPVSQ